MRLLADNPSIEFLRTEAKDLLRTLRAADGTATLSKAQLAVAEGYGFHSWSELKAEVDRRRAALVPQPVGLAEQLADAFGLGVVRAMTPIRYEYMGRRWALDTDRGRFVVRPVFDWIDDEQAEVAVDLQERARGAGVRSPIPVRTPEGGLVRRVLDQNWRVDVRLDLGPTPAVPVTASVAHSAGVVLAAVHEVAPKTDRAVDGLWVGTADRPDDAQWTALLERTRAAGCEWAPELAGLSSTIAELSSIAAEVEQDAVVITNRDINVGAVRMGEADELVVMHWDFAGPMTPEWDLASTLKQWTGSGAHPDAARALLSGYRARAKEVPTLTLGSFTRSITGWLTWLLHRAWEAADRQPSEQRDFAERALRELLDEQLTVAKLTALVDIAQQPA
jgi:hypothetical protein